ncbi:hypothetical protein BDN72DRAFT_964507 [Pluteus cervinus]|uniref:Uncharacterized protein n=1 Tax=Pluteus cervinus TaxID=181527 RepID=A0ACD3AA00_9AGAR|nr:hypothetical protein BDN72DRAFT_964507 [Pluteus cervinus]
MTSILSLSSSLPAASSSVSNIAAPAFRQFTFFDVVPVKDVHDLDSPPEIFKAPLELSTVVSSSVGVIAADIHGSIHILGREFEPVQSWVAHVQGRVTHIAEQNGVLLTMGDEDNVKAPLLKIWDLSNKDKKTGAPVTLRSTKIQLGSRPHPVTSIALSANFSHFAIGLGDGTVLLYRHLDQSIASSNSLTALPKVRTVHESPNEPITGLGFKEPTEDNANMSLFVVTTNRVLVYQISGRGSGGAATVVDEIGAALGCATMDSQAKDMIIARNEAIYLCGTEGRGTCYAYEGNKSSIHTHLNYLIIISPPVMPSITAASATIRNFAARTTNLQEDVMKVTVFDPDNKLVAYSGPFTQGVREVVSQWGQIYVLTNDGHLLCLQEKPTSAKLDMLYRKSLFPLALNVAKSQGLDDSTLAEIHQQYGDHLYVKGDYDGAMQQYIKTIGHLQPSYVIRKYLDAQRIHSLVTYLQELHSLGLANADHTTLLLNTYTKLKDVARLDTFIKTESKRGADDESGDFPFDLETAIRVCRQAGYYEHASYLAKKYGKHEAYLQIQIEDARNYRDALGYLRKLGPELAESNLARYGRAMLESLPQETTQLLIDLCTTSGPLESEEDEPPVAPAPTRQPSIGPSYLALLSLNRASVVQPAVSADPPIQTPPSPSIRTVRADASSRRESIHEASRASTPPIRSPSLTGKPPPPPPPKKLSPRIYFAHFVDHMDRFLIFLETVALRRWGQTVSESDGQPQIPPSLADLPVEDEAERLDQVAVWNTLLELYLTLKKPPEEERVLRDKALRVLKSDGLPYDPTHALIICSTRGYTQGLVLLWEKMGMYEEVLRFWMDRDKEGNTPEASKEVVNHLNAYGESNPHLYPLVLRFLTSTPELLTRHEDDLKRVLEHVVEEKILPPLGVIQVLSRNGVASVGLVKEWLMKRIKTAREEIQTDQELTNSYRKETATKLQQVADLSDTEHPRVFNATRCSACGGQLDLPSIHFMCNHSYHQRCLADNETECPNCIREHGVIQEIRRNNERLADQHEVFLSEVQEGGFEAVASAFSRGALSLARPMDGAGILV